MPILHDWFGRSHPGVDVWETGEKRALGQDWLPAKCERHGIELSEYFESPLEELTLKDGQELLVCSICCGDGDRVEPRSLAGALAEHWDEYGEYFRETSPPERNETGHHRYGHTFTG